MTRKLYAHNKKGGKAWLKRIENRVCFVFRKTLSEQNLLIQKKALQKFNNNQKNYWNHRCCCPQTRIHVCPHSHAFSKMFVRCSLQQSILYVATIEIEKCCHTMNYVWIWYASFNSNVMITMIAVIIVIINTIFAVNSASWLHANL